MGGIQTRIKRVSEGYRRLRENGCESYETVFRVPEGSGASGSRGQDSSERVSSEGNRGCQVRACSACVHKTSVTVNETATKKTLKAKK